MLIQTLRKAICHDGSRSQKTFMPFDPIIPLKGVSKETLELETHGYHGNVYQTILYKGIKMEIIQAFRKRGRYKSSFIEWNAMRTLKLCLLKK